MSKNNKNPVYRGTIKIGDIEINCAVNQNGVRVISQYSINKAFDRGEGGSRNLPKIIDLKALEPFIDEGLRGRATNLIQVEDMKCFEAELIPDICEVWLKARDLGVLTTDKQLNTAKKAEIIMRALSRIGIVALIDEATGYQYNRKKDALRLLLEQYIAEGLQKWLKRFPDKFFEELDRLYGNEKTTSRKRPMYYGRFINKYIYEPIENGLVKKEIDKKNITVDGKRVARFHQWLTTDLGINQLTVQIGRVMGIMEISDTLKEFDKHAKRQKGLAVQEELFADDIKTNVKIIEAIQQDGLEFKDNNFEATLENIALSKKPT